MKPYVSRQKWAYQYADRKAKEIAETGMEPKAVCDLWYEWFWEALGDTNILREEEKLSAA